MEPIHINYLALLVAASVKWVFGAIWYAPSVCGNTWMKTVGLSAEHMKKNMVMAMTVEFFAAFVMADVLAYVLYYAGATTWDQAIGAAFWLWLGFIATTTIGAVTYERRPLKWLWISWGYQLIGTGLMAVIIVLWK